MNVMHHGTLSEKKTKNSIEVMIAQAVFRAMKEGNLNRSGGHIEVKDITNVDEVDVIKYLGILGFNASYKPIEEQCLGTYSDNCMYPLRHVFELKSIREY